MSCRLAEVGSCWLGLGLLAGLVCWLRWSFAEVVCLAGRSCLAEVGVCWLTGLLLGCLLAGPSVGWAGFAWARSGCWAVCWRAGLLAGLVCG